MGKIVKNGVTYSGSSDNADNVKYNNNVSNLDATNVQEAIDKLDESVDILNSNLTQVQSQIVPTASIESGETASKAYSVGDFLVKDGILYKVTKAIAEGDALTVGTNIDMTTVGGELSEKSNSTDRVQLSLDAVAVGKDEDGNTVYEKTFKGSTLSSGTVIDSTLTISKLKWIRLVGGCYNDNNKSIRPLPYDITTPNGRYYFIVFSNSKGLVVEHHTTVKMYHFTVHYVLA